MKLRGLARLLERLMALFGGRASMLEVQNRALIKTARERAERISNLERELQQVERLKAEREFYYKRVLVLEQHNRELTESAIEYSLWGQSLERELAKIDPHGAPRQFGHWMESQAGTPKKRR
jgi:hypothetical protein